MSADRAATPVYDRICEARKLDPLAWAALIRNDIDRARDHRDGQPWPEWPTEVPE